MSRLDQKYLIHRQWVPQLVGAIRDDYRILEVDGARQTEYRNRFIETASQSSLHEHTRGRNIRFKARIRQYGSNLRSFLEVKEKTVHGRTVKARIERDATAGIERPLTPEESKFLSSHYKYGDPNSRKSYTSIVSRWCPMTKPNASPSTPTLSSDRATRKKAWVNSALWKSSKNASTAIHHCCRHLSASNSSTLRWEEGRACPSMSLVCYF